MDILYVIDDGLHILSITTEDRQNWHFQATNAGLSQGQDISISFSLFTEIDPLIAKNWFANLLPEGQSRDRLIASLGISDNDFSLLKAIGFDCAGALQITDVYPFPKKQTITRKKITTKNLEVWSKEGSQLELNTVLEQPVRMSLAGAQKKWAVIKEGPDFYLPASNEASTHIIKAAHNHSIIIYELYLMTLAQEIGFNVPNCHLETVGKGLFYCIDRYDRKTDKQQHINRIHQEDACQALGLPSAKKYEKDKGPTLQQIAKLIKGHRIGVPIKTLQNLIGWQIFNVLTGNCDGHAKNLSIIREGDQWELAPFYDLVSTEALKIYSHELAFSVGGNHFPAGLHRQDWEVMAKDFSVNSKAIFKQLDLIKNKISHAIQSSVFKEKLIQRGLTKENFVKLEQVELFINKQIKRYTY